MQHTVKYMFVFGQPDGGKAHLIARWKQNPQMPVFEILSELELRDHHPQDHVLVECTRGDSPQGYRSFLELLPPVILQNSILIYIQTTYREAFTRLSERDDWQKLTAGRESGLISIRGLKIPFLSIETENISESPSSIFQRFEPALLNFLTTPSTVTCNV